MMKILLVDDNAINRMVATHLLQFLKCDVECAVNGEEAVTAVATKQYDLVLMDCHMPTMDGLTATERIREREKALGIRRLPIIALTANDAPGSRELCFGAGMDDFLSKPLIPGDLEGVIAKWSVRHAG